MLKIDKIIIGKYPLIVAPVSDMEIVSSRQISSKKLDVVDIIEVRVDHFKSFASDYVIEVIQAAKNMNKPIITTIRSKNEGGKKNISDTKRLELFEQIIPITDAVDIELSSKNILDDIVANAHKHKKTVIVSYHNFKQTPSDKTLENILKKSKTHNANITKIAVFAKNKKDILRLLSFTYANSNAHILTISLGQLGAISRILFPIFGSALTYGCIEKQFAPGQIDVEFLREEIKTFVY